MKSIFATNVPLHDAHRYIQYMRILAKSEHTINIGLPIKYPLLNTNMYRKTIYSMDDLYNLPKGTVNSG